MSRLRTSRSFSAVGDRRRSRTCTLVLAFGILHVREGSSSHQTLASEWQELERLHEREKKKRFSASIFLRPVR